MRFIFSELAMQFVAVVFFLQFFIIVVVARHTFHVSYAKICAYFCARSKVRSEELMNLCAESDKNSIKWQRIAKKICIE